MTFKHESPRNWVVQRAKCNIDLIYESLCQVVERDVSEMNKLPADQRRGFTFLTEWNVDGVNPIIQVTRCPSPKEAKAYARFERRTNFILVTFNIPNLREETEGRLTARPVGISGDGSCLLSIGREEYTEYKVWELSRRILEPLFFS